MVPVRIRTAEGQRVKSKNLIWMEIRRRKEKNKKKPKLTNKKNRRTTNRMTWEVTM